MSFDPGFPAPAPRPGAGWYPDPHDVGGQRYWDGSAWTEHRLGPDAGTATQQTLALPVAAGYQRPAYPTAMVPAYGQQVTPVYYAPVPAQSGRPSGVHVAIAWICAVLSFLYFLPWAIAATRGRPNTGGVFLVNLLVGWTVIGWVVALVMACT